MTTETEKSEMERRLEAMAPEHLAVLKAAVTAEHSKRTGDAERVPHMTTGEFNAYRDSLFDQAERGQKAREDKENAERRAAFQRNSPGLRR